MQPDFRALDPEEWHLLREIRLIALKDSPRAFLAKYDKEIDYGREQWEAEFKRGKWIIGELAKKPVSLTGITRQPDAAQPEPYLEYVWVAPECRGFGIAYNMLAFVLEDLKESGVEAVFLWVLDGNDKARRLYGRLNFVSTEVVHLLEPDPPCSKEQRSEEQFRRDLTQPAPIADERMPVIAH